jgi:hypothetical protein
MRNCELNWGVEIKFDMAVAFFQFTAVVIQATKDRMIE